MISSRRRTPPDFLQVVEQIKTWLCDYYNNESSPHAEAYKAYCIYSQAVMKHPLELCLAVMPLDTYGTLIFSEMYDSYNQLGVVLDKIRNTIDNTK